MYKLQSKQMRFDDFDAPMGPKINHDNRWVKKSKAIPWDAIELKYQTLFSDVNSNEPLPARLAIGALLLQKELGCGDRDIAEHIQENQYMQYYCGMPRYDDTKLPFHPSVLPCIRARIAGEPLNTINELIIAYGKKLRARNMADNESCATVQEKDDSCHQAETAQSVESDVVDTQAEDTKTENQEKEKENIGTLIVDATCAPQNIKYPTDINLLNEAREKLERIIDELHLPSDGTKPRTYRRRAREDYLKVVLNKNKGKNTVRKGIKKQLQYVRRNLTTVDALLVKRSGQLDIAEALAINAELALYRQLYEQQQKMYETKTRTIPDRIVSLSQPWVRAIVRGKATAKVEFGAKLEISVDDGYVRLEKTSFDPYNESTSLIATIEKCKERNGHYPEEVLVDKIYRTQENREWCGKRKIKMKGKPLGRKAKSDYTKKEDRQMDIDRIEVERKISHAKGSYGLGLIRTKLKETSECSIGLSIVLLNIWKSAKLFHAKFKNRIILLFFAITRKNRWQLLRQKN
jgi:hypothetical protein